MSLRKKSEALLNILQAVEINRRAWEKVSSKAEEVIDELEKLNIGPAPVRTNRENEPDSITKQ